MLSSIFVTKIYEEPEGCNKFHNEEIRDTFLNKYFSNDQIREEERSRKRGKG
jgi:hypothetical protein